MIPYARHLVEEDDIAAVVHALRSDRLTQGPIVEAFEAAVARLCGAKYAIACNSGTSALHLAFAALDLPEFIEHVTIPALTFVATAAAATHAQYRLRCVDIDEETLVSPDADVLVDYAGYAPPTKAKLIDAAHSFGVRTLGDAWAACFSFHPAKTITTGEGGAVVTNDGDAASRMRLLRDHGRTNGFAQRPGWNFRMSDIHAALGLSQLAKVERFLARRRQIARYYLEAFAGLPLRLPHAGEPHAWHLFVVRVPAERRDAFRASLAARSVNTQVHYAPVYEHGAFVGARPPGGCPVAERAAREVVSLPMSHALEDAEVSRVAGAVRKAAEEIL